jgi:hypothetical protein
MDEWIGPTLIVQMSAPDRRDQPSVHSGIPDDTSDS